MKQYFKAKSSSLLKYALTIISTIIIIGIVGFFVFGVNKGLQFGGGYEIEAALPDVEYTTAIKQTNVTLSGYGIEGRQGTKEDKGYYSSMIYRFKSDELSNIDEIEDKLEAAIYEGSDYPDSVDNLLTIKRIGATENAVNFGWYSLLAAGLVVVIAFLIGWLRHSIFGGIAYAIATAGTALLELSLMVFSRIELSYATAITLFVLLVLSLIFVSFVANKFKELHSEKQYTGLSADETLRKVENENTKQIFWIAIIFIGICASLCATISMDFIYVSFAAIIGFVSGLASTLLVAMPCFAVCLDAQDAKRKALLSRSQSKKK